MDVFEITGYQSGVDRSGVNFLMPSDSFQDIQDGYVYRQVLQSRKGLRKFASRLANGTRVMGIFEHTLANGTTELLAFDTTHAYKYNTTTGVFDQLSFTGAAMGGYTGFNISSDQYISGESYSIYNGSTFDDVFVFSSSGIDLDQAGVSGILFYDGTGIKDFTNTTDNPEYVEPSEGELFRSKYVFNFNGRINFGSPLVGGELFSQSVFFSGINDANNNGVKFNVAGSGQATADTYQYMTGCLRLGNIFILNFYRTNYALEKTTDIFNPYFLRQIPGPLGSDADFSAVVWNDTVKALGKTGVLATDSRQTLRCDNKIPYFTRDEIDSRDFNFSYGGFNRENNQFLWSYITTRSKTTQDKVLVNSYEFDSWATYNMRLTVFGQTDLGRDLAWNQINASNNPAWSRWDTTEEQWNKIGLSDRVQKTLAGDDLGFIYEMEVDYDDYFASISNIVAGSTSTLTIDSSAFQVGDIVAIENVEGMTEINNYNPSTKTQINPFYVVSAVNSSTEIEIDVNSNLYTAYTQGGKISKVIDFQAKTIPFNPYRDQGRRIFISHVEFLIDTNGGFLEVSVSQDGEGEYFKEDVKIKTTDIQKSREWVTMVVDNEANFMTFLLRQNTVGSQLKLTSMRIHARPGGLTSG